MSAGYGKYSVTECQTVIGDAQTFLRAATATARKGKLELVSIRRDIRIYAAQRAPSVAAKGLPQKWVNEPNNSGPGKDEGRRGQSLRATGHASAPMRVRVKRACSKRAEMRTKARVAGWPGDRRAVGAPWLERHPTEREQRGAPCEKRAHNEQIMECGGKRRRARLWQRRVSRVKRRRCTC